MNPPVARRELPGLQAERTNLAWERTGLAMLVSGALLVLRHLGAPGSGALVLAGFGLLLALLLAALGVLRARQIRSAPAVASARWAVMVGGAAAVAFGVAVIATIVFGALS